MTKDNEIIKLFFRTLFNDLEESFSKDFLDEKLSVKDINEITKDEKLLSITENYKLAIKKIWNEKKCIYISVEKDKILFKDQVLSDLKTNVVNMHDLNFKNETIGTDVMLRYEDNLLLDLKSEEDKLKKDTIDIVINNLENTKNKNLKKFLTSQADESSYKHDKNLISNLSASKNFEDRALFHLPNAMIGKPYSGKLEGKNKNGNSVIIIDAHIPDGVGLVFDVESSVLSGNPLLDGEHKITIKWTNGDNISSTDECLLIVNPDPRSLWKVIDPPADDPYSKLNSEGKVIHIEESSIVAASRRGRSHEHGGTFRDDDFFISHDVASKWSIIIVADGAGSAKNSRMGSKLAANSFGNHLESELSGEFGARMSDTLKNWYSEKESSSTLGVEFHNLFHKAGLVAVNAIETEAARNDSVPKQYATTLLAAAIKKEGTNVFLATFWMGDGAIAAYGPSEKVRLMGTPDSGEFAGQTRFLDRASLMDSGFSKRVGIGNFSDLTAVILMTDGVSDPKFETDNGLATVSKWDSLWHELSPLLYGPDPDKALIDWLGFFSPGHHDDRTIAILF